MPIPANGNVNWNERLQFLIGRLAAAKSEARALDPGAREVMALLSSLDMLEVGLLHAKTGYERATSVAGNTGSTSSGRD